VNFNEVWYGIGQELPFALYTDKPKVVALLIEYLFGPGLKNHVEYRLHALRNSNTKSGHFPLVGGGDGNVA